MAITSNEFEQWWRSQGMYEQDLELVADGILARIVSAAFDDDLWGVYPELNERDWKRIEDMLKRRHPGPIIESFWRAYDRLARRDA